MAYVYGHYKADTGELFYIGKGNGKRAWEHRSRNPHWKAIVNKHGLSVKILEDNLTDEQAYQKEKSLVEEIGLDNLSNMTEGGIGLTSEVAKKVMNRADVKKKVSDASKRHWQDETFRNKITTSMKITRASDNYKKAHSTAMKKLAENPDWLEKTRNTAKTYARDPVRVEKIREASRRKWQDPEHRKKVAEAWERKRNEKLMNGG